MNENSRLGYADKTKSRYFSIVKINNLILHKIIISLHNLITILNDDI